MLYQQNQEIRIIVRREGGGNGNSSPKGTNTKTTTETGSGGGTNVGGGGNTGGGNIKGSALLTNKFWRTNMTHSLAVSRQLAKYSMNYFLTGLAYEKGDTAYQQGVERQWEVLGDAGSIITSTAMGATYGMAGGLPGVIIGAMLGAVSSSASVATKYAYRDRDYEIALFKENNSIAYKRARANTSETTGRLR